ncbi:2-oxo acid dehydrogenase subunit E2, partial [Erythrobacter sp.]|uniref:2-oxo acid dehydrogenase subunit E2 n=1 Tax=Erythrobacter sp. TaxID=1042 RepID=UPI00311F1947
MPTPIKMPALSPTMEEGTLARWLVKPGDTVSAGDIMAEIETDKATMEFEAVDEGTIVSIAIDEGTEGVKVGTVIAMLAEEGEDASAAAAAPAAEAPKPEPAPKPTQPEPVEGPAPAPAASAPSSPSTSSGRAETGNRVVASPLAKRIAEQKGIDLAGVTGSGPNGRIVKADVEGAPAQTTTSAQPEPVEGRSATPAPKPATLGGDLDAPYEAQKLNNVRKVIARRLTEAKQTIPHIYLTVDVRLDALLKLRGELNKSLEPDGVKLSVNDLLIKALARALQRVPKCNVSFQGDELFQYNREDISVAVAAPSGLITPIIRDAGRKGLA